jgi:hypothetical protein
VQAGTGCNFLQGAAVVNMGCHNAGVSRRCISPLKNGLTSSPGPVPRTGELARQPGGEQKIRPLRLAQPLLDFNKIVNCIVNDNPVAARGAAGNSSL